MERVDYNKLKTYVISLLQKFNLPEEGASIVADALIYADLKGTSTHGVRLLPRYLKRLEVGGVNTRPAITAEEHTPVCISMDGDNGFGQVVAHKAMEYAIKKAKQSGMALVTVKNSNHLGALGYFASIASKEKLIGFISQNTMSNTVPPGGIKSTIGNNPFAVAVPRGNNPDFILDMAISKVARSNLDIAAQQGVKIDPDWGVDSEGNPTDDPQKVLQGGSMLPLGAHKGFGMSVVLETLCGILSGASYGYKVTRMDDFNTPYRDLGHVAAALDPSVFMKWEEFQERLEDYLSYVKSSPGKEGKEISLHGERSQAKIAEAMKHGVLLEKNTLEELRDLGSRASLDMQI